MKWIKCFLATVLIQLVSITVTQADTFDSFWYDGKAEISTYQITEMRYGEPRDGIRIMVFVTEPMRISTHIKPDSKLPYDSIVNVIKLNDIRKFNTGIYDYNIMTSVFTAVEKKNKLPEMSTMKISFTSQEWCGNVFEVLKRNKNGFTGNSFSYFESEGEQKFKLTNHNNLDTEDNLWIIIRELKKPILTKASSMKIRVLPSSWARRKTHAPIKILKGILSKGKRDTMSTVLGEIESIPFEWNLNGKTTKVWVEADYPHRILSWVEPDGSNGSIIASRRETYWRRKSNDDLYLREKLGIARSKEELL
jgi:hypothetical protein